MQDFCHLHCHTQYSLLDGAAQTSRLLDRAAELSLPAVAITDHGNLYGVPEFYTGAKKRSVQPIVGCEFYITPSGMQDRKDRTRYHQVLLAKNEIGYQNLISLSSQSYLEGYYYKPRLDREVLKAHAEGLIATTCCLQGEVLQTILRHGEERALEVFKWYLDVFGEDYYIEIQDHGIGDQSKCNEVLLRWADTYGVEIIATNDVHYVAQEDSKAQDILLCLQTGKDYHDPARMRFEGDQFYLKSADEMRSALRMLSPEQITRALENTRKIAEKCDLSLSMGTLLMPHYPLPPNFAGDMDGYLKHLVFEGAARRYGELSAEIAERLTFELSVIAEMGYAGYFLIVQDFTTAARDLGVSVGPGRGSVAGSAVAYCLGITNIDPLAYDLLFERFLNPERVSMPDIDIDFDDRGRGKVIDYVVSKYGRDSVCQIVTFGTMGARSVIRDVARVLSIPLSEADRIAKLIPEGPKVSLADALEEVDELRQLQYSEDAETRRLIQYAQVLEGSARHTGVHAAGVIIAPGRVSDYVPVALAKGKSGDETVVTTQYDGRWVEEFGLLKMDFLGLKTLTVLNDALALIQKTHGIAIDIDQIPFDDEATYALFQRAETIAIFQFESSGMREWLRKLKPDTLNDLIAMNALYRPGPMDNIPDYIERKHGRKTVRYPHPMLQDVLEPTYGIPVYQEQVMQMAQVMGGYTLGGADLLRRAMGKKKQSEMDKQRAIFVEGALTKNVSKKLANEVFDLMARFAGYGFNKSHAAAYSVVAYQTAYLKANYPACFMAAAMTNDMGDTKRLSVVIDDARHLGIEMLPPSINHSQLHFDVEEGKIRYGLGCVKGLGTGAIQNLVSAREKVGRFDTLFQLVTEIDLRIVSKKALEGLVKVGALDELTGHRAQLVEAIEAAYAYGQRVQADRQAGQNSLFGGPESATPMEPALPMVQPWNRSTLLREERELMGFYLSGHPLQDYEAELRPFVSRNIADVTQADTEGMEFVEGRRRGPQHTLSGIITDVQQRRTKQGKPMLIATLEDLTGQAEVVFFAGVLDRVAVHVRPDEVCLVKGSLEFRGGGLKVVGQEIWPIWKVREQLVQSITVTINPSTLTDVQQAALVELCEAHRGSTPLYFTLTSDRFPSSLRLRARNTVVSCDEELLSGLRALFGSEAIALGRGTLN